VTFKNFFRVLGDAKKPRNQHTLFVKDREAKKIAIRERRKIKQHLSPVFDEIEAFPTDKDKPTKSEKGKMNVVPYKPVVFSQSLRNYK